MLDPGGVDQAFAQRHIAAALAVNGLRRREQPQAVEEAARAGEAAGMQFGIASRQPAGVAVGGRRLVGQRREGDDLRPGRPPAADEMRIDEGKGLVARQRDPLARRPQRDGLSRLPGQTHLARELENAPAIEVRLDEVGQRLEPRLERLRLGGLDESEMAFGQGDCFVARQRADDREAQRLDRLRDEPAMPLAADPVDHDAGDAEPRVIDGAALDDRRGRLRLARHVDDEQDRKSERRRDVGRGAAAAGRRRNAVEQAHRGLAQRERPPAVASAASAPRSSGGIAQELRLTPSQPEAAAWKAGSI